MGKRKWTLLGVAVVLVMVLAAVAGCGGTATTTVTTAGGGRQPRRPPRRLRQLPRLPVSQSKWCPQSFDGTRRFTKGSSVNQRFPDLLESIGNQVAGRPIQLIFGDDASNPQQGLERVRKLVEREARST